MIKTISISDLLNRPKQQIGFAIDRFEEMEEPENIEFPHKHDFYEILWIIDGTSKHTIDYKKYVIEADTLFFISPGQLHLFEEWQDIKGYCIIFTEQFFLQIFQNKNVLFELSYLDNLHETPFVKLNNHDKLILQPIVDLLYQEAKNVSPSSEVIQALILIFLRKIQPVFSFNHYQTTKQHEVFVFKKFKHLVETQFEKNIPISQYASQLNISSHYLNALVKAVCGKTSTEIIKERTILEAQQLLHFSELTISQIADQLGFEDSSYFARFFKKQVGLSPFDFRKRSS
jgi:AraC family transcriptional activator of pobA